MNLKKIISKWWFWLIIVAILIFFLFPMFNCKGCYVFPGADGQITSHGKCCQSLIDLILGKGEKY
ncbi:MAG: hypothetical protein V1910_02025 [bacterium]|nr:hypothetical protein [Patescibacteria group bacterium]